MPDYGLLSGNTGLLNGIAEGLRGGLDAYKYERDRKDKLRLEEEDKQLKRATLARHLADQETNKQFKEAGLMSQGWQKVAPGAAGPTDPNVPRTSIEGSNYVLGARPWNPNPLQEAQLAALSATAGAKEHEATPAGRLEKAGGDVKGKIGNVANAMQALTSLEDALISGNQPGYVSPQTPLIGKLKPANSFHIQSKLLTEEIGRLESGGAINKDEVANYISMVPTQTDLDIGKPEAVQEKLNGLRTLLENKFKAYGFEPKNLPDLKYDPAKLGYGPNRKTYLSSVGKPKGGGLLEKSASASNAGAGQGPKPGTVEDGHRFKGGDPANPSNWEMVK